LPLGWLRAGYPGRAPGGWSRRTEDAARTGHGGRSRTAPAGRPGSRARRGPGPSPPLAL